MIEITVNGILMQINENTSMLTLLKEQNYDRSRVAVELNGNILPKAEYESRALAAGDKVEIVSFVGGG